MNTEYRKKTGQNYFPNLTIESLSVFDVLSFCKNHDYDGLTAYLLDGIRSLSAAGAQYAALTGITPHIVFDRLVQETPIPLVSMIDTARDYAEDHGYQKIGLLGTLPTMNGTFFQDSFAKHGISVITPTNEEKNYIGNKIESELELGNISLETQIQFRKIAEQMIQEEKVQALVLGCTELPMIFDKIQLSVPYIDVMQVHIDALVDLIING